ncbi:MAG: RNA methyltransferase [Bacteroidetes bacterium]|nr:MAG: RNA methyltransferase [Bacteroidota bacterium]
MLTKSQIQFIKSLQLKKYRDQHRCFVAEGSKLVLELARSRFSIRQVYALPDWHSNHTLPSSIPVEPVKPFEMERITGLSTPGPVLAVVDIPGMQPDPLCWEENLTLVLDDIRDPGNLGTMIRIADWFGIRQMLCSPDCVDCYNSKVVQATMGSIARVAITYLELPGFLASLDKQTPVYGMMLDGQDIYLSEPVHNGLLVVGNEAHGISEEVATYVKHRLSIPFYPADREDHAESLNAAVATGIACSVLRRRRNEGRRKREEGRGK